MKSDLPVSARAILSQFAEDDPPLARRPLASRFPRRALLGGGTVAAVGATIGYALQGGAATTPAADLSGLPVVNIAAAPFNADPTGATDSTAAILAAIAAAGPTGRIYAPVGTFLILGASNNDGPIVFDGDGVFEGAGCRWSGTDAARSAATTFKCGDQTAGIVLNGAGVSTNFTVDGNHVATTPLQRGLQGGAGSFGTFTNIAVINSAQDGWTIISAQNDSYYSCVSHGNARDNLYIDGGAGGLDFYHWNDSSCGRYGIRSDGLIAGGLGSYGQHTEAIRFWGGISEVGNFLGITQASGVSRIHLRQAIDWAFPYMNIYGAAMSGPAMYVDQSSCYRINLSHALIWSNRSLLDGSPGHACVEIDGGAGFGGDVICDGTYFVGGDTSIYITQGKPMVSAAGMLDYTTNGPVAGSGVQPIDTLLAGRTGKWQKAALNVSWSGYLGYRTSGFGRTELRGTIYGPNGSVATTLPAGYRPVIDSKFVAPMGTGVGVLAIGADGHISPTQEGGQSQSGISLDGLSLANV
jgi:hypothetical protein